MSDAPLADLSDEALIRAALDEETYDDSFRSRVRSELEMRGLSIPAYADRVLVRSRQATDSFSISECLAAFDDLDVWSPVECTNALGERVTVQRGERECLVHLQDDGGYAASARLETHAARSSLEAFLSLGSPDWGDHFDVTTWPVVDATRSTRFLKRLSQELEDRGIDHLVVCPGPESSDLTCDVRVPNDQTRNAEEVLSELYARIEGLRGQATELANSDRRKEELEVYEILKDLTPDRPAVVYNRAAVLFELDDLEGAVDGFLEALSMGMPREDLSQYRGNRTGLLQMSLGTRKKSNPEYFEDIEAFLLKIEPRCSDHIPLIHGLATLARLNGREEDALSYYTRILDLDPEDQAARTNIALLQQEDTP